METALAKMLFDCTGNGSIKIDPPIDGVTVLIADIDYSLYCKSNGIVCPFCSLDNDTRLELCEYVNEKLNK